MKNANKKITVSAYLLKGFTNLFRFLFVKKDCCK